MQFFRESQPSSIEGSNIAEDSSEYSEIGSTNFEAHELIGTPPPDSESDDKENNRMISRAEIKIG